MSENDKKIFEEIDWRIRVFDSLSFPTLILRPDKVIMNANQVFLEKHGSIEKIVGKTCHEIFYDSKEPCSPDKCPLPKVLGDKKGHSILRRIIEDEEEKWEDRVFSPILDDSGEVLYIMESVRDVTRLKTLEKELKKTKEFFESVIQSSASAIVAADRSGKILFLNRAAEELFGYSMEEALQRTTVEQVYPSGMAREIMRKLRDENLGGKGKLASTKITIINANGEEIPVEITAAIIYEGGGREVATMGIYNDLRDKLAVEKKLKEAQAQLAQSEKLASVGQLAAGVAHEINNPLGGILLYANLAMESINKSAPVHEYLGYVIEDANRCKDIVKNLLAYSRQTSLTKTINQMNTLVDKGLVLIRDQKVFSNIIIDKRMSDEMMLIHSDKDQLSQVIINLVMNAIDAMNGEGILTLRTYRDKPAKKVYLEVSDTGCGIPKENLSKIFDPFFTTKEPGKGTGLGLSTAYGIIKENGGNISVKETSPQGTTFLVELPLYVPSDNTESS